MNLYSRQSAIFRNQMRQQCGALLGIVQGMLSDGELNDAEINFLHQWLQGAENVRNSWPGDVIYAQIDKALSDGKIDTEEREHLVRVLLDLAGGRLDDLVTNPPVAHLALDKVTAIDIAGRTFCLTGDFAYGPRSSCEAAIEKRGGTAQPGITKKLNYVVVGGLGSSEWKHGSFGTKVEKAIQYKRDGCAILIIHEDVWSAAMFA